MAPIPAGASTAMQATQEKYSIITHLQKQSKCEIIFCRPTVYTDGFFPRVKRTGGKLGHYLLLFHEDPWVYGLEDGWLSTGPRK